MDGHVRIGYANNPDILCEKAFAGLDIAERAPILAAILYGFKSCDTVKKARRWLDDHGVEHSFFDYRVEKLDPKVVDDWFGRAGWEAVFNRNSTTFKELPEAEKQGIDANKARAMILAETNLIKRPVLDTGKDLLFGFRAGAYEGATRR